VTVSWKSRIRCDGLLGTKRSWRLVLPFAFLAWNAVDPLDRSLFFYR